MGINKSDDELGNNTWTNGHDPVFGPPNWHYHILNKRPKDVRSKRFVVFLSLDLLALFALAGIIDNLTSVKEIIALIVAIGYIVVRMAIGVAKFLAFIGKHNEGIKKGWRSIKELFKE